MKIDCNTYRDLIPLYLKHQLSNSSKQLVEEHIASCPVCQEYFKNRKIALQEELFIADEQRETNLTQKQVIFSQWMFLACGVFLSILSTMTNDISQHIILLPFVGLIGYLLTGKTRSLPIIVSILLTLTIIFKDALQGSFDSALGYILYLIIFFFLALVGTLCGKLLKRFSKDFKSQVTLRKIQIILAWMATCIASIALFVFFNVRNGNLFSACYAQFQMKHYLETMYPESAYKLATAHYNYKDGYYSTSAKLFTDETANPFTLFYRKGKVWDDYFSSYLEDEPTQYRLNEEVTHAIGLLLEQHHIPYNHITCSLEIAKGTYDNVHFSPETFEKPLDIGIYALTDIKQTNEEFTLWCEEIRRLLLNEGYLIDKLTLESDPHLMANRLALTLNEKELENPIEDVNSYKHFVDYGLLNDFDETMTSAELGYEKVDFYYDSTLSSQIKKILEANDIAPIYVNAELNDAKELNLSICCFGERISIDHFAEITQTIMSSLQENHIFDTYKVMPLLMKYGWGTPSQSYSYTLYDEQIADYNEEDVIQTLLKNQDTLS